MMQYQINSNNNSNMIDTRPKTGPEVKVIIQSLKLQAPIVPRAIACNPAKMFKSSIQRANDSGSLDTGLEFKSLPSRVKKNAIYVNELREILKESQNCKIQNENEQNKPIVNVTPSKLPFTNRKNLPEPQPNCKVRPQKLICEKYTLTKVHCEKIPASSTPYRPKTEFKCDNDSIFKKPNSMSPPSSSELDIDTFDDDFDQSRDRTLVKCFSLTRSSCRRMASFRNSLRKSDSKYVISAPNSPKFERRSLFTSSLKAKVDRSSIVSTSEVSPLQRQKNIKIKSNSKFLSFFRSNKTTTKPGESDLTETCSNLSDLLAKSEENDGLGCVPLLTKDNVDLFDHETSVASDDCDKTLGWGENFEFSFLCEPSTSDIEDDDDFIQPIDSGFENDFPFVRVHPPSEEFVCNSKPRRERHFMENLNSSPFRRSISDPALIRLANKNNDNNNNHSSFVRIIDHSVNQPQIVTDYLSHFDEVSSYSYFLFLVIVRREKIYQLETGIRDFERS